MIGQGGECQDNSTISLLQREEKGEIKPWGRGDKGEGKTAATSRKASSITVVACGGVKKKKPGWGEKEKGDRGEEQILFTGFRPLRTDRKSERQSQNRCSVGGMGGGVGGGEGGLGKGWMGGVTEGGGSGKEGGG